MFFSLDYLMFMVPAFLLALLARFWVNSTYRKWSKVRSQSGVTGFDAARSLIRYSGLPEISLEGVKGELSDHYDPRIRTLRLSQGVAQGESVAALAIAAHEIGHALQDQAGYLLLRFRNALVPAVNIGSNLGFILILIGLFLRGTLGTQLAWIGVGAFALGAVFALATLPIELNASNRARVLLRDSGLIRTADERRGVNAVLNAAAFTYVAGLAAAILQLLYWVSLLSGGSSRRR